MEIELMSVFIIAITLLWIVMRQTIKDNQHTIEAQQDTINKLLNREPVTYKEVGQEKPKSDTDRPIAWAGAIADRDEL